MPTHARDASGDHGRVGAPGSAPGAEQAPEPSASLPATKLFLVIPGLAFVIAGAWYAAIAVGPWGSVEGRSGVTGIAASTFMAMAGLLVMTPWKARRMGDWMTMWLAATVFRLLGTPVVVYLLYSALSPSLAVKPLVLSVALTYLVVVMAEAGIIATHVRRLLPTR